MNYFFKISILSFSAILLASASFSQGNPGLKDTVKTVTKPAAKGGPKKFDEVITAKAERNDGLLTIYKLDGRFFMEINNRILGKDILMVTRMVQSAAGARNPYQMIGYGGDEVNENEVRFERGPNQKLFIRQVSYNELSKDSTQAMFRSVNHSNLQAIAAAFEIKAFSKDNDGVIVDVTDYVNGDNDLLFFDPSMKRSLGLGAFQSDKSYVVDIRSYPNNTEIRAVKTYSKLPPQFPPSALASGTLTVELNCSMILLPEKPMQARFFDPRIGYFRNSYMDFDADPQRAKKIEMITRWRLEPKVGEMTQYLRGELVEPEKPIVFYIDPATPKKWVPYLIQGVNDWQKAFEQAGFKNAIVAKEAPTRLQDSTWSLEDARYSAIVYKPSTIPNASGPNVHDPRSGEILESHISWYHNVMVLIHNWYMIQAGPSDPRARKMKFDDELMGQLIRFVSSHEVGHTLGLLHNFGSSATVPVDSLRNKAWVEKNGHTPSIMDYARFNYVAQPEDHIAEAGLFPRIGAYDKWAIEWGYKLLPGNPSAIEEKSVLNRLTIDKLKNKRLNFGRENDDKDPRSQNEDIGDNAMKAGFYGLKNLKFVLEHLAAWTTQSDEGYDNFKEMYKEVLGQFTRYMGHVTKNVAGVYETPKTVEQPGDIYTLVPKAKQAAAVKFLNEQLFSTPVWLLKVNLLDKANVNPVQITNSLQNPQLDRLLSADIFKRLISAEAIQGDKTYTVADLISDLHQGIWSELRTGQSIDVYRRNLQKEYTNDLEELLAKPGSATSTSADPTKSDLSSLARAELTVLSLEIRRALPLVRNKMTIYHLKDIGQQLHKALAGKEL